MVTQHVTKFNSHMSCGSRDVTYLICQKTSQDHVIKRAFDCIKESYTLYRTFLIVIYAVTWATFESKLKQIKKFAP